MMKESSHSYMFREENVEPPKCHKTVRRIYWWRFILLLLHVS